MTNEDMMVAIPVEEYEHLKECKAQLMEIYERRIAELRGQMAAASMASTISNAAPINIPNHRNWKNLVDSILKDD